MCGGEKLNLVLDLRAGFLPLLIERPCRMNHILSLEFWATEYGGQPGVVGGVPTQGMSDSSLGLRGGTLGHPKG